MASKQKPLVTPRGRFVWPHFHAPDTKFDDDGVYRTKFVLPEADAQPLIDAIEAALAEQYAKAKKEFAEDEKNKGKSFEKSKQGKYADKPYVVGEADDEGTVQFSFKMKASGKSKKDGTTWHRVLAVFDAKGNPIPKGTRVGGGSEGKIAYTLNPFTTAIGTGISLRLESVQILVRKEFERDAKAFGFGEEEGFSVNEATDAAAEEPSTEAGASESGEAGEQPKGSDF
jgi:hypothetical protein